MYYKLELTMYYRLELTMYYYCLWYDKLWGPSQRVVTLLFCISDNIDLCILVHGSLVDYIYLGSTPNIWASMGLAVQGSNVPSGSAFSPTCFLCSFVKLRNISPLLS